MPQDDRRVPGLPLPDDRAVPGVISHRCKVRLERGDGCWGASEHIPRSSAGGTAGMLNYRQQVMGKVEKIEQDVQALSPDELAQFRVWFLEYDWAAWDRQLERDVQDSRLDELAGKALRAHAAGKTTQL
jgi:hypothetical protein